MKDREGNDYFVVLYRERGTNDFNSSAPAQPGRIVARQVISPARQQRKATGLSGRQWVKLRKAMRRSGARMVPAHVPGQAAA